MSDTGAGRRIDNPKLPAASLNLIHGRRLPRVLPARRRCSSAVREALKPGGRVVLYSRRIRRCPIRPEHKMSVAGAKLEVEAKAIRCRAWIRHCPGGASSSSRDREPRPCLRLGPQCAFPAITVHVLFTNPSSSSSFCASSGAAHPDRSVRTTGTELGAGRGRHRLLCRGRRLPSAPEAISHSTSGWQSSWTARDTRTLDAAPDGGRRCQCGGARALQVRRLRGGQRQRLGGRLQKAGDEPPAGRSTDWHFLLHIPMESRTS